MVCAAISGLFISLVAVLLSGDVSATKTVGRSHRRLQDPVVPEFNPDTKDDTCEDDKPYRWPSDKMCHKNKLYPDEGCPVDKPTKCFKGECSNLPCKKFPPKCGKNNARWSCWNGECTKDDAECDVKVKDSQSGVKESDKLRRHCKNRYLYTRYEDGICRANSDTHRSSRCPLSMPLQCPQGTCTRYENGCTWTSRCPSLIPF